MEMARARGLAKTTLLHFERSVPTKRRLTTGPGRLSQALGITRARDNDKDLTSPRSGLWVADDGFRPRRVARTPRIGIHQAARRRLRYLIAGNSLVSRR